MHERLERDVAKAAVAEKTTLDRYFIAKLRKNRAGSLFPIVISSDYSAGRGYDF